MSLLDDDIPAQQHTQTSSNQDLPISQKHQSIHSKTPAIFQFNPTITGPNVQLLDTTKPYKIGDAIKVGGRTLQSDSFAMKYWNEEDLTVTETPSKGHVLNMAGYSYFVRNYGKNFTSWECEHRRKHQCSTITIRSSSPNVKNYFKIYSIQGEHLHESTPENVAIRKFKQRIRDRCRQELSSPRTIYDDELFKGKYSADMLANLPTFYNIRK